MSSFTVRFAEKGIVRKKNQAIIAFHSGRFGVLAEC